MCREFGDSVHLPIPRSKEENDFYRTFFTDENLWLDISYNSNEANFKSDSGSVFAHKIQTVNKSEIISSFDWIDFDEFGSNDVILSSDGKWRTKDGSNPVNSICIYKIEHDNDCAKCFDEAFCRYTDRTRKKTECVCQVNRDGDFCQNNLCDCQNGGYCRSFNQTELNQTELNQTELNRTECVCPFPYFGPKCELGKIICLYETILHLTKFIVNDQMRSFCK